MSSLSLLNRMNYDHVDDGGGDGRSKHLKRIDELEYTMNKSILTLSAISETLKAVCDKQECERPIEEGELDTLNGICYLLEDQIKDLKKTWNGCA